MAVVFLVDEYFDGGDSGVWGGVFKGDVCAGDIGEEGAEVEEGDGGGEVAYGVGDAREDAGEGVKDEFGEAVSVVGDAGHYSGVGAVYGVHLWLDVFNPHDLSHGLGGGVWAECGSRGVELYLAGDWVLHWCADCGKDE